MKIPMRQIQQIERDLYLVDNKGRGYTHDKDTIISLIFRCDMTTAQGIVNRIGKELGIGSDAIVVLKTAECITIAKHAWDVLKGGKPLTDKEIKRVQEHAI